MNATRLVAALVVLTLLVTLTSAAGAQGPQQSGGSGCVAGTGYDPACDVNRDGDTNIVDLQLVATHWGNSGTWSTDHNHWGESWSGTNVGLTLHSNNDRALHAITDNSPAILAEAFRPGEGVGIRGKGTLYGVVGQTTSGQVQSAVGVRGLTTSTGQYAYGVQGLATATTGENRGVYGRTDSSTANAVGVKGVATSSTGDVKGVIGMSASTNGGVAVAGINTGNRHAGWFETGNWTSLQAVNNSATAETLTVVNYGGGPTGYFGGHVQVTGNLYSASGSFKIDHPVEPESKYLNHSSVQAPERMNVYNGNVVLDANGEAWVNLPDYFEALNRDFRYQLTAIGAPAPNLYIAVEIAGNRFKIAGGPKGGKVSWQVIGIRKDPWAVANPVSVEEEKSAKEKGFYLHPELYNQPESKSIKWLHVPRDMLMLQDGKPVMSLK